MQYQDCTQLVSEEQAVFTCARALFREACNLPAGFAAVPLLTPLVVTLPYVLGGKIVAGAVVRSLALESAAAWSPSKNAVVVLTTTDPGLMLLMLTATLLFGYAVLMLLMNCRQHTGNGERALGQLLDAHCDSNF